MFDLDKWQEIFETIRRNRLRTLLTGFSVGWGIFMLVLLLGAGKGLENGVTREIASDAINSIFIFPGRTAEAYKGYKAGRRIRFTNDDYELIKNGIPEVEYISSRFYIPGTPIISRQNNFGSFSIRCVHPGHQQVENTAIDLGRYLTERDLSDYRKVAVIGRRVRDALFGEGVNPIGQDIKINNFAFTVVGVSKESIADAGEEEVIYLPITTAQRIFNGKNEINRIIFTMGDATLDESKDIARRVRQLVAERHHFNPKDRQAIWVRNNIENFQEFQNVMMGMRIFIWFIAVGTLMAGIIGVGNIMLIVVKERTKEIGIRKALGATPNSIIGLILQESVFITTISGYLGILLGIATLEFYNSGVWLELFQSFNMMQGVDLNAIDIFYNPSIDLGVAFRAMILLVVAGAFAGLMPAYRAAKIRPIVALREE
ncbi:MAG: ABC transporter permease [Bacteroidota bacterium]